MPGAPKLPAACRWIIRAAGWIVPASQHAAWIARWERESRACWAFLQDRPEISLNPRSDIMRFCSRCLPQALALRRRQIAQWWLSYRVSASLPFVAIASAAVLFAMLTGGFSGFRAIFDPVPYRQPRELMVLWQNFGSFGRRLGVPAPTVQAWEHRSAHLSSIGAYYERRDTHLRRGTQTQQVHEVPVTPGFFPTLGVKPYLGRTFVPIDAFEPGLPLVLSYRFWISEFDGDPGAVGQTVTLGSRSGVIVGVMPRSFAFPSREVEIWTVFPLWPEPPRHLPYLLGAVGRLPEGTSVAGARSELRTIAGERRGSHWNGALVELTQLVSVPGQARQFFLYLAAAVALAGMFFWRFGSGRHSWRAGIYLLTKIAAVLAVLLAAWLELLSPFTLNRYGAYGPLLWWASGWLYAMFGVFLAVWAVADQRRRCPVCLRRLTMPVTIGSWSSSILDPVSTELICGRGHGSLYVSGTQTSYSEPERWQALDESWRDLFEVESGEPDQK
jgi:hypothetical protein